MSEATFSNGASMPCTREEVLQFMGAVCYQLAAPSVADAALRAGAKAAGWEGMGGALAQVAAAQPKAKKGRKSKEEKAQGDAKVKKPRSLTAMNVFTSYLMEWANKDPKFKLPEVVDADGKKQRGGVLSFAALCWRQLSDSDKERFISIVQPVLDDVTHSINTTGARPVSSEVLDNLRKHLEQHKQDKEFAALVDAAVVKAQSSSGAKEGLTSPAAKATPSGKSIPNGTQEKGDTEKKRKKQEEKEKEKKKQKKDKAEKEKESKKKKDEKEKKAAAKKAEEEKKKKKQESSSSSDDSDSSEEEEKPSKKASSSSGDDSSSDDSDSE